MKAKLRGPAHLPPPSPPPTSHLSLPNPTLFLGGAADTLKANCTSAITTLDASCIEKLLLHCAAALESNDGTLAQQVMWVLNNIAVPNGDPNQRLTSFFLKALLGRSAHLCHSSAFPTPATRLISPMPVTELARYIDLTPWHRFGFTASNGAIFRAVQGRTNIHIVDFGITHCMQWPTLIDSLSKRAEGPPSLVRITVLPSVRPPVPPVLAVSIDQIGIRLANFARSKNLSFELHVVSSNNNPSFIQELTSGILNPTTLDLREDETVVVNCHSFLRYLTSDGKDGFLESIHDLNPSIVTLTDEDGTPGLDSPSLSSRITACFNYLWIPFDALETFLPKDSKQRAEYEADVGQKIENIIGFEGEQRIERIETGGKIGQRMRKAGFTTLPFDEEMVKEVKGLLDEHASGWGMKREEDVLGLTWKGHSAVFTTAWVPCGFDE